MKRSVSLFLIKNLKPLNPAVSKFVIPQLKCVSMGTLNQEVTEVGQLLSCEVLGFGVAPVMSDEDNLVFTRDSRKKHLS